MHHPLRPAVPPAYGPPTAAVILNIIQSFPRLHDQNGWEESNGCKTTRCVAGWAQWLHQGAVNTVDVEQFGAQALGLGENDAARLFYDTDNAQAVAVLRKIVASEPIDWDVIWDDCDDDEYGGVR
jgi:hypothetical protein